MNEIPVGYKTALCSRFEKGYCMYGDACTFAHGESDYFSNRIMNQNTLLRNKIKVLSNELKQKHKEIEDHVLYTQWLEYELELFKGGQITTTLKLIDDAFNYSYKSEYHKVKED